MSYTQPNEPRGYFIPMFKRHENGYGTYTIIYLGFRFVLILGRNK
jgi:hypothetical protein